MFQHRHTHRDTMSTRDRKQIGSGRRDGSFAAVLPGGFSSAVLTLSFVVNQAAVIFLVAAQHSPAQCSTAASSVHTHTCAEVDSVWPAALQQHSY